MKNIFCVDIGGSKLICGALNLSGEILDTYRADYPEKYDIDTILKHIRTGYEKLKGYDFFACGVAIPGLFDNQNKNWLYSPFSGISDIPIDFCYAEVFSQQLKNLMDDGDIVLLISASGNSPNIVSAAEYTKSRGGKIIGFSGFDGGKLKELSDVNVNIPSDSYEKIEDLHMMLTHIIVCYFKALGLK